MNALVIVHTLCHCGDIRYALLNQCSDEWAQHGREWLNLAFQNYPSDSSSDLQSRFKSNKDKNHRGAYFELITHALLRGSGASIDVQPRYEDWGCQPDFLVKLGNEKFVVEAKTVVAPHAHQYTITPSEEKICTDLEELKDEFFVWIHTRCITTQKTSHGILPTHLTMALSKRKVVSALLRKGFLQRKKGHHIVLVYQNINGDLSKIRTRMSHGSHPKDLSDYLVLKIAKQVNLHRKQFEEFVSCVINQTKYEEIINRKI